MTTVEQNAEFLEYQDWHQTLRNIKPSKTLRVLVVEDDEVAREAILKQITKFDPQLLVETASSVDEATERMWQNPPDLLIADFYLDGSNTAVELLRDAEKCPKRISDVMVVSAGIPLPALFAAEREGLQIKFVKKPIDRFLLYRFLQFDLDRGYYL